MRLADARRCAGVLLGGAWPEPVHLVQGVADVAGDALRELPLLRAALDMDVDGRRVDVRGQNPRLR